VVEEDGEGGNGSMEVARWRFTRRELRKAVGDQLHKSQRVINLLSKSWNISSCKHLDAPAEVLNPGMRCETAIAPLEVSFNSALGDG
jgi:hypothetical protein